MASLISTGASQTLGVMWLRCKTPASLPMWPAIAETDNEGPASHDSERSYVSRILPRFSPQTGVGRPVVQAHVARAGQSGAGHAGAVLSSLRTSVPSPAVAAVSTPQRPCWSQCVVKASALVRAQIAYVLGKRGEDRMVGENQIFRDVAVWDDQAVGADGLEAAIGAGPSGDPADKNNIAIGRMLDQLGAEVGDEGEQVDDALSVLLRPANGTRRPRPVSGNARRSDCGDSDLYPFRARIGPGGFPTFDRERAAHQ